MNEARETQVLETPSGKKATLRAWLTARERNTIRDALLAEVKMDPTRAFGGDTQEAQAAVDKLPGDKVVQAIEQAVIRAVVVDYDGSPDDILNRLLDSRPEEYDAVSKAAGLIYTGPKA